MQVDYPKNPPKIIAIMLVPKESNDYYELPKKSDDIGREMDGASENA